MSRGPLRRMVTPARQKLVAHRCRREARVGTDLAQGAGPRHYKSAARLTCTAPPLTTLSGSAFTEASGVSGCWGRCLELGSIAEPQPHQR